MATEPKGSRRIQVKVLDAETGKELATHQLAVPHVGGHCCTTTTSSLNGPPAM
jgi:hypothetical protein